MSAGLIAKLEAAKVNPTGWTSDNGWRLNHNNAIEKAIAIVRLSHENEEVDYLKVLEEQCWDLRCIDEPTAGGDDGDIAWHVVGHWMSLPHDRVIGYGRTPKAAIEDAMRPRDYEGNLIEGEEV